ncbi:hypothetical protein RRG08_027878 [Elysia crispata]|uniref:Uncharacterized protein n=1 Tax=Elysia crispata TaxID=231223 RepID=A0AAE1A6W4_9GAST|nr:hypothetical protein RRG08_027878 [Elysia crispata]
MNHKNYNDQRRTTNLNLRSFIAARRLTLVTAQSQRFRQFPSTQHNFVTFTLQQGKSDTLRPGTRIRPRSRSPSPSDRSPLLQIGCAVSLGRLRTLNCKKESRRKILFVGLWHTAHAPPHTTRSALDVSPRTRHRQIS